MSSGIIKSLPKDKTALRRTKDSTFDCIYKFYYGKKSVRLTDKQETIRERWEKAYALLCSFKTPRKAAQSLEKWYSITQRQAYNDVNNAMKLFGDPKEGLKTAKRAITNEWIIKGIEKAWQEEDLAAYERLIAKYSKINGLEVDNENAIADLIKEMKPTMFVFSADPETLKKQADNLMEGTDQTDDIDYTEVEDED